MLKIRHRLTSHGRKEGRKERNRKKKKKTEDRRQKTEKN
jgi:hypothetical protein